MEDLKSKKICVLMGGRSREREISLRSGKNVFESLKRQGFNVISMDLVDDLVFQLRKAKVDIVFNILHGKFGEDGIVQSILELAQIPFTGSKVLASAISMNKLASKKIWKSFDIPTPRWMADASAKQILDEFVFPLIIKPASEGSSFGITIVKDKKDFKAAYEKTLKDFDDVFVEEFIDGREVTVGIIGRDEDLIALPILELVPKNDFYDFDAKYTEGMTEFILPARLSDAETKKIQEIALSAHRALGCYGVSRVDFIISKDGVPYVTELNSIPGMTNQSDLPAEAEYAGISFDDLVLKILESAF
jgi:D-alanine-D-alanine ligase